MVTKFAFEFGQCQFIIASGAFERFQLRQVLKIRDFAFDRLMQAAQPVAAPDRDAFFKDIAAELGRYDAARSELLPNIPTVGDFLPGASESPSPKQSEELSELNTASRPLWFVPPPVYL
jgi:hypothetical protein